MREKLAQLTNGLFTGERKVGSLSGKIRDLGLFLAVGGAAFVIEMTVFNALILVALVPVLTSNFISISMAGTFSFFVNLRGTFRYRNLQATRIMLLRFFLVTMLTIASNQALVFLFVTALPESSLLATNLWKFLVVAGLALVRFHIFREHVYKS